MAQSLLPEDRGFLSLSDDKKTPVDQSSLTYTYARAATSENTREAYRADVRHFIAWGGMLPATPEMIIRYLEAHADSLNPKTLKRRLTALKHWHTYQTLPDPTSHPLIRKTLAGILRIHGRPAEKAPALTLSQLKAVTQFFANKNKLIDWRDNALLQIGFFGAFRRSELSALCWEQINFVPKGVEILLVRSKTDQTGIGRVCAIPYGENSLCPVSALKAWQEKSTLTAGPVFVGLTKSGKLQSRVLSSASISRIVRKIAILCDLPNAKNYSGHSLRRGFATSAAEKGANIYDIMRHGRWQSERTVLEYVEEGERFEKSAANLLLNE